MNQYRCWFIWIEKNEWVEEGKSNTVAGCDLCHMWGALMNEMPPSVCMCLCVWCIWGAESTSE